MALYRKQAGMKRSRKVRRKDSPHGPVVEMMLAKSVLEEKNELLEGKERIIVELRSKANALEAELETVRDELERRAAELSVIRKASRQEGILSVVEEVVRIAADYHSRDGGESIKLACRLFRVFHERYGLEVLESVADGIDPEIHRVVELDYDPEGDSSIQVLSKGYQIAGRVIRPMLVKVIRGGNCPVRSHDGHPQSWKISR
jgi:molecular chaperone GrpE (heat shock protein)